MKYKMILSMAVFGMIFSNTVLADGASAQNTKKAKQGEPCSEVQCEQGLQCVKYSGIAGPAGPSFSSCEIPCRDPSDKCPDGQSCITIYDGPGRVCRPGRAPHTMRGK